MNHANDTLPNAGLICCASDAVWGEWEAHILGIDAQIAAYKGHAPHVVTHTRSTNLLLWEQWEGQMRADDTPSVRRRANHQRLAKRRRLRRTYWTRIRESQQRREMMQAEFDCPIPRPGPMSCAGLALLNWLCCDRVMITAMVGIAFYFALTQVCPGFLAEAASFWKGY